MSNSYLEITEKIAREGSNLLSADESNSENCGIGMCVGIVAGVAVSATSMLTKDSIEGSDIASAVITTAACGYIGHRAEDVLRGNTDMQTFAGEVALVSAVSKSSLSVAYAMSQNRDKSKEDVTEL